MGFQLQTRNNHELEYLSLCLQKLTHTVMYIHKVERGPISREALLLSPTGPWEEVQLSALSSGLHL